MSRVFSTTIMKKIARMPKPATAMIMNSRMLRTALSICTAANSGPCLSRQVETPYSSGETRPAACRAPRRHRLPA